MEKSKIDERIINQLNGYTATVRPASDDEPGYEAAFRELGRSVVTHGKTPADALKKLYKNGVEVISDLIHLGRSIPEPEPAPAWIDYSGKVTVRMPRSLHCKLHMLAEDEGVSLNSLIVTILAWGAENKHCSIRPLNPALVQNNLMVVGSPYASALDKCQPMTYSLKTSKEVERDLAQALRDKF